MQIIDISKVQLDSILARDLKDSSGSLILAKGTKLTKPLLKRLSQMNVSKIAVEGASGEFAEQIQHRLAELSRRFEGQEKDSFMMEIARGVREHLEQAASATNENGS